MFKAEGEPARINFVDDLENFSALTEYSCILPYFTYSTTWRKNSFIVWWG